MNMIGVLQNASQAGYERKYNDLHIASFMLPLNDPKNDLCQAMNIVEIFDGDVSKGLYRILDNPECEVTAEGEWLEYSCEHVIAFLLNEVIDGYVELGGTDARTPAVLRALLARQETVRWQLGTCDFNRQFQYSWENTNILDALFSVPKCFDVDYHWTYDTSTFPWTINLVQPSGERSCEIRRKRNMVSIKRTIDSSKLCNRLYCKGYGEGVNQMTIAEVNNGKPYVEDAASQAKYGILSNHLIDRRFTDMENLKAYGQQVLNRLKDPVVTYTAKAIDLNRFTGLEWDKLDEGKIVHMIDEEKHIDVDAVIVSFQKSDPDGDPLDCDITISNAASDVSSDIESIAQRASISAQYAQGATNLYCQQFADNADESHGAVMKFYVPADCTKINEVLLNWSYSAFRAYSKSASAGGSTTVTSADGGSTAVTSQSGGSATVTSADGGEQTVTSAGGGDSTQTSTDGGATTVTSQGGGDSTVTSADGGDKVVTSAGGGDSTQTSTDGGGQTVTSAAGGEKSVTSAGGGDSTITSASGGEQTVTSASGGESTVTSASGGESTQTSGSGGSGKASSTSIISTGTDIGSCGFPRKHGGDISDTGETAPNTSTESGHKHTVKWGHQHVNNTSGENTGGVANYSSLNPESGTAGSHSHTVDSHSHDMMHSHLITRLNIPELSVNLSSHTHEVTIPSHTHDVTVPSHTHNVTTPSHTHEVKVPSHTHDVSLPSHTHEVTVDKHSHNVSIPSHTHDVTLPKHSHDVKLPSHTHDVKIPNHTHNVSLPSHTHSVSLPKHTHSVTIPSHTHQVNIPSHTHRVELPNHTHGIEYGIYQGSTASSCTLKVDGVIAQTEVRQGSDINIIPYLSKDTEGKITRSTWHTVEVIPDKMSRIEMNLFVRTFITSHTGGNY
jgi:phage minor structural protein